jgi:hypothetical protein
VTLILLTSTSTLITLLLAATFNASGRMPSHLPVPLSTGSHTTTNASSYTLINTPTESNDFTDLEDKSPAQQVRRFVRPQARPPMCPLGYCAQGNAGRSKSHQRRRPESAKYAGFSRVLSTNFELRPLTSSAGWVTGASHV